MKYYFNWISNEKGTTDRFKANVPGNIQSDYAESHNYGDIQYADNVNKYRWMEDVYWIYSTEFDNPAKKDENLFFVSLGIDYECKIYLNNEEIYHNIGMYSKIEINLMPYLKKHNALSVEVFPVPKSPYATHEDREQANQAVKPPVSYGWDWHPRLIPSGMWQEAYVETRKNDYINDFEVRYSLSEDLKEADITFDVDCNSDVEITLFSPDGEIVYSGYEKEINLKDIKLWWCNEQGNQSLYHWTAKTESDLKEGNIGFRRIRLVMNDGAWEQPVGFPKSQSAPPITFELNGRKIFAKGSNWVNPEMFVGEITDTTYEKQIRYAKEAHMNLLRVHGGTIINKEAFYEYCDLYGIMVWQEFTLACNNYLPTKEYMAVLSKEAISVIKKIRRHVCHVLWCGGNELFNNWSKMTEQSPPLRLLNKLCFEYDSDKPFIMTSPVMGMAHGHYLFYDFEADKDLLQLMYETQYNAYTEFGVPSLAPLETIKRIIPEDEIDSFDSGISWEIHCGIGSWRERTWACDDVIEYYFGKQDSIDKYIELSNLLQCEGYKAMFGEARRQWPKCSVALNWDYNEPWMNAAGNNLLAYPSTRKPAYYAVRDILSPITFSVKAKRFDYLSGDEFSALIYFHNDTENTASDRVNISIVIDRKETFICSWAAEAKGLSNKKGPMCYFDLPETDKITVFYVILKSEKGINMQFRYVLKPKTLNEESRLLNQ